MRTKILWALAAVLMLVIGCVRTVDDRKTAGMPFGKDKVEGKYERPVDQLFQAAKDVVTANGVLVNEETMYNQTHPVKTVHGRINQREVWIRIEGVDSKLTAVVVQARTSGGGADVYLAHEVEKQIALKLVR
jgi:hypothetical protein